MATRSSREMSWSATRAWELVSLRGCAAVQGAEFRLHDYKSDHFGPDFKITVTEKVPNVNNVVRTVKNFHYRDILNLLFEGFIVVARIQQEPGIKYLVAFHHFQWGPCGCGRAVQVHGQGSRLEGHESIFVEIDGPSQHGNLHPWKGLCTKRPVELV